METREIYERVKKDYTHSVIAVDTEEGYVFFGKDDAWHIKYHQTLLRKEEEKKTLEAIEEEAHKEADEAKEGYTITHEELHEMMPYFQQATGFRVYTCREEGNEIVVRELVVNHSVSTEEECRIEIETKTPLTTEQKARCWEVYKDLFLTQVKQAQDIWATIGNKEEILESLYESAERAVKTFETLTK